MTTPQISCIILAGGRARRMQGKDKGLVPYLGKAMIEHVLERIAPQVDDIVISANRHLEQYAAYSTNVIADSEAEYAGPLAGIASCLPHCRHQHALVVACDMPALPQDLLAQLLPALGKHDLAIISCEQRLQLAMLISKNLQSSLDKALQQHQFKLLDWVSNQRAAIVEADAAGFINLNTLDDLSERS